MDQALLQPRGSVTPGGDGDWASMAQDKDLSVTEDKVELKDLLLNVERDLTKDKIARIFMRDGV